MFANGTDEDFTSYLTTFQKVETQWEKTELDQFRESLGLQQLGNQVKHPDHAVGGDPVDNNNTNNIVENAHYKQS